MDFSIEMFTRPEEIKLRKKIKKELKNHTIDNLNLEINVWPKRVKVSNSRHWKPIKKFNQYSDWAEKNNLDLRPGFKKKTVENDFTNERYIEIIFPTISIAIYKEEILKFVFPTTQKTNETKTYYKVGDLINSLKGDLQPKLYNTIIEEIKKEKNSERPKSEK